MRHIFAAVVASTFLAVPVALACDDGAGPDLTIGAYVSPSSGHESQAFTFTLHVHNLGELYSYPHPHWDSGDASSIVVTATVPPDLNFTSFGTVDHGFSCGNPVGGVITCNSGSIAGNCYGSDPYATIEIHLTAKNPFSFQGCSTTDTMNVEVNPGCNIAERDCSNNTSSVVVYLTKVSC
jgi:hypothetical protein